MSKKWYRQCGYRRELDGAAQEGVSYLPEKLAQVGKRIYFGKKEDRPEPEAMWTVTWVSSVRRAQDWLVLKQTTDKRQRKASDV